MTSDLIYDVFDEKKGYFAANWTHSFVLNCGNGILPYGEKEDYAEHLLGGDAFERAYPSRKRIKWKSIVKFKELKESGGKGKAIALN